MAKLLKIMAEVYGAGPGVFAPEPILWAAGRLADAEGVAVAKAELKKLNRRRERLALIVAVPPYGDRLF